MPAHGTPPDVVYGPMTVGKSLPPRHEPLPVMHRREFLHPRQFVNAAGPILGELTSLRTLASEAEAENGTALVRFGRRCMATTFEVVLPFGTPGALEIGKAAFDLLDNLEVQLTVYRESSEVSRLNRVAPFQAVRVESGLFELLRLAASLTESTRGAFDVTAGALVKIWGFFRGPRRVPAETERLEALENVGMRHVELDPAGGSVHFLRPGLEINLGSIGKGYALDCVVAWLDAHVKVPAVLLQGGSSSVYARGTPSSDRRGWAIDLKHPWLPGRCLGRVWLRNQALGTSAATFQYLEHEGRKLGHVLDPRTGWPASGVASASVVAPTAAEADALSTAFFVGGANLARSVCTARPDVGVVLLPEGDDAETIVLNLARESYSVTAGAPAFTTGDIAGYGSKLCGGNFRS
jgi:thiamine biosynthesis lipoprotein